MQTFVMFTRLSPATLRSLHSFEELEKVLATRIERDCPGVKCRQSFAVLGPNDYLDIFEAADIDSAFRVAALVRTPGHGYTEIRPATEWKRFKKVVGTRGGRSLNSRSHAPFGLRSGATAAPARRNRICSLPEHALPRSSRGRPAARGVAEAFS